MSDLSKFSRTQAERFQRHFALAGFGIEAQARLLDSRAVVVGAGGLGAPILTYLAAAGVGAIEIIDHDVVDRSNLHRQVIHSESTLGQPKTSSAAERMRGLHPEVGITEHREPISAANALELIEPADIVIDGSDNFSTRYVVSDACEILGKPLVSGSILRFSGQVSLFWSRLPDGSRGPTYRDLYPEAPDPGEVPSCAEAGVLGVLPGVIGSIMATEAIKFLAGIGEPLTGRVVTYDALTSHFGQFRLNPDPDREPVTSIGTGAEDIGGAPEAAACPVEVGDAAPAASSAPGQTVPAASPSALAQGPEEPDPGTADIDFNPFTGEPKQADDLSPAEFRRAAADGRLGLVLDVREPHEHQAGALSGAVNIPLMDLWQAEQPPEGLQEVTEENPAVVYCEHGVRSRQALAVLKHRYPEVPIKNLLGGYALYQQS
ncbi:molybdopterin-synthase adenylyltransferase MoeB [Nesterenkonia alkaliphila]|uniref:molybdopterin-synthase adenylyltransferase MoeB n=1 Tax=Nesterenkonia alkaliphila TaxID=1463631 RepID=UPI0012FAFB2C|nr:molybdopterin-synthase adenylyltransferase MoeB [Nesterenkonia alkaliphila]GFZ87541.1 adenylyltransferase/sulfurtransferase MoeZ [Nesterenkonia alkaliphila]